MRSRSFLLGQRLAGSLVHRNAHLHGGAAGTRWGQEDGDRSGKSLGHCLIHHPHTHFDFGAELGFSTSIHQFFSCSQGPGGMRVGTPSVSLGTEAMSPKDSRKAVKKQVRMGVPSCLLLFPRWLGNRTGPLP